MQNEESMPKRRARYDSELTIDEIALYDAGRLTTFYNLCEAKFFKFENVAPLMGMSVDDIKALYPSFRDEYGFPLTRVEQRDAIVVVRKRQEKEREEREKNGKE